MRKKLDLTESEKRDRINNRSKAYYRKLKTNGNVGYYLIDKPEIISLVKEYVASIRSDTQ